MRRRCRASKNKRRGFTLIELLIVIAIIAILAAILFPVFARARENARRASCQSNMKQLGLGMMQYSQDYDENFPIGNDISFGSGVGWGGQLYPYIKSTPVFRCSSDFDVAHGGIADVANSTMISYAYNMDIPAHPNSSWGEDRGISCKIAKFNAVAKTVMLFEISGGRAVLDSGRELNDKLGSAAGTGNDFEIENRVNVDGSGVTTASYLGFRYATGCLGGLSCIVVPADSDTGGYGHFDALYGRHLTGSNYLMADGHVKWFRGAAVSPGWAAVNPTDAQQNPDPLSRAAGTEADGYAVTFSPI